MRSRRLLFAVLAMVLVAGAAAQQTPDDLLERLRDYERSLYPQFVEDAAGASTPTATTTPPTQNAYIPPVPDVLAADLSSTTTWRQTRTRLEPQFDDLQAVVLLGSPAAEVRTSTEALLRDVRLLTEMAPFQAPNQQPALEFYERRLDRLVELLLQDYQRSDQRQLANSVRLLEESFREYAQLLVQAEREAGYEAADRFYRLPDGWQVTAPRPRESFTGRVAGWEPAKLLQAYEQRLRDLEAIIGQERDLWRPELAVEMGELARIMATRTSELPVASRLPFQHAALQLDVQAEALHEYLVEGNKLYARRHLRVIRHTVQEAEAYFVATQSANLR